MGETHGGYTFCALATWSMLRALDDPHSPSYAIRLPNKIQMPEKELNLSSLLRWASSVQANPIEGGGFKGRTNKLVDGCYGWWCGGLFSLIGSLQANDEVNREDLYDRGEFSPPIVSLVSYLFAPLSFSRASLSSNLNESLSVMHHGIVALQEYVLLVAQAPGGGLRDKPGKPADAYHTSCNLSGLSSAQSKMSLSSSTHTLLRTSFISPWALPKVVELEVEERGDSRGPEMMTDDFESDREAEQRMREIWSRTLAWRREGEILLVGGEDNELVTSLSFQVGSGELGSDDHIE